MPQPPMLKEAEADQFYEDLEDFLELITHTHTHTHKINKYIYIYIYPIHHRGFECKGRKSRDTWSNKQIWPWSTKWSRAKANIILPREHICHSKHPFSTTQEMTLHMDINKRSILKAD